LYLAAEQCCHLYPTLSRHFRQLRPVRYGNHRRRLLIWQWMRFPGDVVFALGALLMAWDFIVKSRPLLPRFIVRLIPARGHWQVLGAARNKSR
jgi:hypothetical protein